MLIDDIRTYGREQGVPITLDDTLLFLCSTIRERKAQAILEIGTAIGFGTITMASEKCVQHVDSVEIDSERYNIACDNVAKAKLTGKINLYLMDAMEFLKSNTNKYDLIYLDGPKGQYINYLPYLKNALNLNGVLVADNLKFHGMVTGEIPVSRGCRAMIKGLKNYIEAIKKDGDFSTQILDIGDGVGVSVLTKNTAE